MSPYTGSAIRHKPKLSCSRQINANYQGHQSKVIGQLGYIKSLPLIGNKNKKLSYRKDDRAMRPIAYMSAIL